MRGAALASELGVSLRTLYRDIGSLQAQGAPIDGEAGLGYLLRPGFARTTNPAWTPLFFRASAVVTESGGPLSHGAVTAREIGIPAVMAIPNVFVALPHGCTATVNGTDGIVSLA